MALKNDEGNYLKISLIHGDILDNRIDITCELWKNEEVRITPTEFNKSIHKNLMIEESDIMEKTLDNSKSIRNNIITLCYEELKKEDEFSDWIDC